MKTFMLGRLVRNHFDQFGDFNNLPVFLLEAVKAVSGNLSLKDKLYEFLGYDSDATLSAEERYILRKQIAQNGLESVNNFGETVQERAERLSDLDVLPFVCDLRIECLEIKDDYLQLVANLLVDYVKNNRYLLIDIQGEKITLYNLLVSAGLNCKSIGELNKLVKDKVLLRYLESYLPKILVNSSIKSPYIVANTLVTSRDITDNMKLLSQFVIEQICRNASILPIDVKLKLNLWAGSGNVQLKVFMGDINMYKCIQDISHTLKLTVKQLLELSGVIFIDFMKTFEDKIILFPLSGDTYILFTEKSENVNQYIIVNKNVFQELYEKELLSALYFERESIFINDVPKYVDYVPMLFINKAVFLKDFLAMSSKTDVRVFTGD